MRQSRRAGPIRVRHMTEQEATSFSGRRSSDIEERLIKDGTFWKSGLGTETRNRSDQPWFENYAGARRIDAHDWSEQTADWSPWRTEGTAS